MAVTTKSDLLQAQSSAPVPVDSPLSEDQVDDLVYFARNGQLEEFQASLTAFAESLSSSPLNIIALALDQESGNSPLHMASANGHIGILKYLASLITDPAAPQSLRSAILNLQNRSGNTPLHWAALNSHLEAVKILIAAGANSSVRNKAGHDVVYEAAINSKEDVVEWLLKEGHLEEEAADDDDDDDDDDGDVDGDGEATLRDRDEGKDSDHPTTRVSPLEESFSPAKNYEKENCDEMGEKVQKLSLG